MGFLSKRWFMPIGIGVREKLGEKVDLRCLGLSGWINFTRGEINCFGPEFWDFAPKLRVS